MAGYHGLSMSNNAVDCYQRNIKPISRWLKDELVREIRNTYGDEAAELARKHTVSFLRENFLSYDSWHHTGKVYRCTDFYRFSDDMKPETAVNILLEVEKKVEKPVPVPVPARATWLEWTGTRKHPESYKVTSFGRVVGDYFCSIDGVRKRVDGKYFSYRELCEEAAKNQFKKAFGLKTCHRYRKWLESGSIK